MFKIRTESIVIFLLAVYAIESLVRFDYISLEFKFGLVGLAIASVLLVKSYKLAFYTLLLLSVISFFGIIKFSQTSLFFGVNSLKLNFISAVLFIFLCIRRRDLIRQLFKSEEGLNKEQVRRNKIKFYKKEFSKLPTEELSRQLENDYLSKEATEASSELLKERENR
jgi:hypothetical protein